MRLLQYLAALVCCVMACSASALELGTQTLVLDANRSSADFEVKVLWLIGVHGRFGAVHGSINVDSFHAKAVVDAYIDTDTVSMRVHKYETWVKSPEFFDVVHYPQIHFVSNSFPIDRLTTGGDIDGTLTLRGVERRVSLALIPSTCPAAPARDCPALANGSIQRSEFGMSSRRGTLSDSVDLGFAIYVMPAPAA